MNFVLKCILNSFLAEIKTAYCSLAPYYILSRTVFHHEDEANFSMLSYEARIHHVEITGSPFGSARGCVRCAPGTMVSPNGAFCVKCTPGTYSTGGTSSCTQCPAGTFSNKVRANLLEKQMFRSIIVLTGSYFLKHHNNL